jgi:hypothetical protein
LELAKSVLDLLLILRLGQFSLSDLNQLGRDGGLEEALLMNSPKSTWDSALDDSYHFQLTVALNR